MSILQDLDPKYAKIHTQSSFAGWKSITWILSLLLILAWASWLVFTLQIDNSVSGNKLPGNGMPDQGEISNEIAKAPSIERSQIASTDLAAASPANSGAGSAIIQEAGQPASIKSEKGQESMPFPSIAPEEKKLTNSNRMSKTDSRNQSAYQQAKRQTGHAAARKPANNHANKVSADKNSQPNAKKAAERDVDIITAIVR